MGSWSICLYVSLVIVCFYSLFSANSNFVFLVCSSISQISLRVWEFCECQQDSVDVDRLGITHNNAIFSVDHDSRVLCCCFIWIYVVFISSFFNGFSIFGFRVQKFHSLAIQEGQLKQSILFLFYTLFLIWLVSCALSVPKEFKFNWQAFLHLHSLRGIQTRFWCRYFTIAINICTANNLSRKFWLMCNKFFVVNFPFLILYVECSQNKLSACDFVWNADGTRRELKMLSENVKTTAVRLDNQNVNDLDVVAETVQRRWLIRLKWQEPLGFSFGLGARVFGY